MASGKINTDWLTVLLYLVLVALGWLAIYTADFDPDFPELLNTSFHHGKQLIWVGACLVIAIVIQFFDTRFYTGFAYFIFAFFLLLLVATLFVGAEISGSRSWIRMGSFSLQPAEFAKFATCLALAKYLSNFNSSLREFSQQLWAGFIIILPAFLVLLQGDAGSALVYSSLMIVLYREGLSGDLFVLGISAIILFVLTLKFEFLNSMIAVAIILLIPLLFSKSRNLKGLAIYIIPIVALAAAFFYLELFYFQILLLAAAIATFIGTYLSKHFSGVLLSIFLVASLYSQGVHYAFNSILKPHQQNRIGVVLGTIEDKRGVGYNLNQSKIAIGSGGPWGKGFLQGTQNKGDFVPELSTDFIFCTIGEEFGFLGSTVILGLFLFLLLRIVHLAERQKSKFSRIYAYGVASILFFHLAINIGMTIGLVPVIGIPLPFISYGGSSLLGFTTLLFVLVKLDSERMLYLR